MAQGLHSCGLYTQTLVVKGSTLSHTVLLGKLALIQVWVWMKEVVSFVNLSLCGFQNQSWTKCSLCFFVVPLQTLFRLSFCLGVYAFSTHLVAVSLFGLGVRVAKYTFIACLVRILVSFIAQRVYFFLCSAKAGSIADSATGHRLYSNRSSYRPAHMENSHWWRYRDRSRCHPKNVCHCCFYRQTYWSGDREVPVNRWYDCRKTGFLLRLLLIVMWILIWPFVLCGYCCYYCCAIFIYIVIICFGEDDDWYMPLCVCLFVCVCLCLCVCLFVFMCVRKWFLRSLFSREACTHSPFKVFSLFCVCKPSINMRSFGSLRQN